jgi:hypothetical protein
MSAGWFLALAPVYEAARRQASATLVCGVFLVVVACAMRRVYRTVDELPICELFVPLEEAPGFPGSLVDRVEGELVYVTVVVPDSAEGEEEVELPCR